MITSPLLRREFGFGLSTVLCLGIVASGCSTIPEPVRKTHSPSPEAIKRSSPSPIKSEPLVSDFVKTAQELYQNNKIDEAHSLLWSYTEEQTQPESRAEFWNLRGLIELNKHQPEAAQLSFQKALTHNRQSEFRGYYQYNYASALYESNRTNDAADILNSIDLAQLDTTQQLKVINLKQKIHSKIPPATGGAKVVTPGTDPFAVTAPDVYHGPTRSNRIGLLIPLTGKYETFGKKVQKAVELAFQNWSNSDAKKYEIVPMDSGETVPSELDALKKLVEEQQVIAVIGPVLSKGIEEVSTKAAFYQVPLLSIAQVQGSLVANTPQESLAPGVAPSFIFSCSISNRDQASKIVEFAMKTRGFSKFAILAPSNKPGAEMANAFWDEVEQRKGVVKAFEYYDPEITDFREPVDKAIGLHYLETRADELKALTEKRKELNITHKTMKTQQYFNLAPIVDFDAVFIADDARIAGQIIPTFTYRDAKDLIYLGMTTWNSSQFLQRTQDQSEGALFPVAFDTLKPAKTSKAFYDLFLASQNTYPGEFDAITFDAASMVLKVMDRSPSTRNEFRERLENISGVEAATGVVGMVNHRCSRKLSLYTVKKGKFELVDD